MTCAITTLDQQRRDQGGAVAATSGGAGGVGVSNSSTITT